MRAAERGGEKPVGRKASPAPKLSPGDSRERTAFAGPVSSPASGTVHVRGRGGGAAGLRCCPSVGPSRVGPDSIRKTKRTTCAPGLGRPGCGSVLVVPAAASRLLLRGSEAHGPSAGTARRRTPCRGGLCLARAGRGGWRGGESAELRVLSGRRCHLLGAWSGRLRQSSFQFLPNKPLPPPQKNISRLWARGGKGGELHTCHRGSIATARQTSLPGRGHKQGRAARVPSEWGDPSTRRGLALPGGGHHLGVENPPWKGQRDGHLSLFTGSLVWTPGSPQASSRPARGPPKPAFPLVWPLVCLCGVGVSSLSRQDPPKISKVQRPSQKPPSPTQERKGWPAGE